MEPLSSELRRQLKRFHPGLTDSDIDHYEDLASQSFALDSSGETDETSGIDRERAALLRARMPNFALAAKAAREFEPGRAKRAKVPPRITTRRTG